MTATYTIIKVLDAPRHTETTVLGSGHRDNRFAQLQFSNQSDVIPTKTSLHRKQRSLSARQTVANSQVSLWNVDI